MSVRRYLLHLSLFLSFFMLNFSAWSPSASAVSETQQEIVEAMSSEVDINSTKAVGDYYLNATIGGLGVQLTGARTENGELINHGLIPTISETMTAMLVKPPVSSGEYIADLLHNAGFVQPAYAQGIGFAGLTPVLQIWKAFRNMVYFAFIVVFVIIGFMIMMRKKISSNSIVTIQEALPQIILALILVTFSYAIAGFVIDLIYLSIFIFTGLFEQFEIFNPGGGATARNLIFGRNIISLGFSLFIGTEEAAGEVAQSVSSIIAEAFGSFGSVVSWITTPLAYVIIAVAIVIALFRTFFTLVKAYVSIILATIFAPVQLLVHAFPGSDAFQKWFQGLIANAAVFPVAAIMVFLGAALVGGASNTKEGGVIFPIQENVGWAWPSGNGASGWVPPLIMGGSNPETGVNAIRAIIGLGMIMLLPEVVNIVYEALKYKPAAYADAALKNAQAGWAQGPMGLATGLFMERQKSAFVLGGLKAVPVYRAASGAFSNMKARMRGTRTAEGKDSGVGASGLENRTVKTSANPQIKAMQQNKQAPVSDSDINEQSL